MASLNKVMIIGNLGRDPEVSYTPGGIAVAKLSIATTDIWNDKSTGEKRERTEWHRIVFFGKQAETIGRYMSKGKQLYVEGRLQTSSYEKDGITRYSTDIIASNFQFLGQKQDAGGFQQQQQQGFVDNNSYQQQQQAPQQKNPQQYQQPQQQNLGGFPEQQQQTTHRPGDDDIPF